MLKNNLLIALLMMKARPVRSILSWMGIYIGILALVIILAIHAGTKQELIDLFRTEGARIIMIQPQFSRELKRFGMVTLSDANRIRLVEGVVSVLPRTMEERDARSASRSQHIRVVGMDEHLPQIYRIPLIRGRLLLSREVSAKQPVALITRQAAADLYPFSDPLGAILIVNSIPFEIVGILDWQPSMIRRTGIEDPDLFVPYPWLLKKDQTMLPRVDVRVREDYSAEQAIMLVQQALSRGDQKRAGLYNISTLEQYFQRTQAKNDRALYSLLAIAAVSLLVGGIGIANVMLTSVTERTREIGVRKALGATRRHILAQFLVESSVLCGSGGFAAIGTGWLVISVLIKLGGTPFALLLPTASIFPCLGLTLLIGLVSGLYPASRAAALSPAEALRYE